MDMCPVCRDINVPSVIVNECKTCDYFNCNNCGTYYVVDETKLLPLSDELPDIILIAEDERISLPALIRNYIRSGIYRIGGISYKKCKSLDVGTRISTYKGSYEDAGMVYVGVGLDSDLSFVSNKYEIIHLSDTLQVVSSPLELLQQCKGCLAPEGLVQIRVPTVRSSRFETSQGYYHSVMMLPAVYTLLYDVGLKVLPRCIYDSLSHTVLHVTHGGKDGRSAE